ncbi:hypothetical protein F5B20DRAFT_66153 [Whalleya microplaca]|nr:hypothetical protein F5B20DRAFT_66153 [Whalleya microplaca]
MKGVVSFLLFGLCAAAPVNKDDEKRQLFPTGSWSLPTPSGPVPTAPFSLPTWLPTEWPTDWTDFPTPTGSGLPFPTSWAFPTSFSIPSGFSIPTDFPIPTSWSIPTDFSFPTAFPTPTGGPARKFSYHI